MCILYTKPIAWIKKNVFLRSSVCFTQMFYIRIYCKIGDRIRDQEKKKDPKVGEVKQTSRVREVAKQRNMGHYVAWGLGFES